MRFFLHADHGDLIKGWVVPDNPVAISRVCVSIEGRRVAEIPATLTDDNIRQLGWHSTGQCHFEIRDEQVPGLAQIERLEIFDVDTNILVHRRLPDRGLVPDKVVLVNTGILPETALQSALFPHFRLNYFGIGRFPEEVLRVLFDTATMTSCLLSGAIAFPRYEAHFVQGETLSMMLIHDPFVEMATRLIWLRDRSAIAADPAQSWRLGPLADAAGFAAEYDFTDAKSLKRLFRTMPEAAYHLLYNPLTRQLGTRMPEDRLDPGNSIIAVEILARLGLVGHRDYFDAFATTVFDRLGIEAGLPLPTPIQTEVLVLADRLRELRIAQDMVNFDTVISDGVRASVAKNWGT